MNSLEKFANTATNYFWGLTAPSHLSPDKLSPEQIANIKIVAHRGAHDFKNILENSNESFEAAVQNQLWGIEFDVRFTKNNVPVIHHDPNCERLYNCSAIIEQTELADLNRLVPQLPTLKEIVKNFGKRIHLLIEIKEQLTTEKHQALAEILKPLNANTDYHLLTLTPHFLEPVSFAPKNAIMAVDWLNMQNTIDHASTLNFGGISGHFMLLNDDRLKVCKERKLITGTGFIETKGAFFREVSRGIDWIFTNHPRRLKAFLA